MNHDRKVSKPRNLTERIASTCRFARSVKEIVSCKFIFAVIPYEQSERHAREVSSRLSPVAVVLTLLVFGVIVAWFFRRRS